MGKRADMELRYIEIIYYICKTKHALLFTFLRAFRKLGEDQGLKGWVDRGLESWEYVEQFTRSRYWITTEDGADRS